MKRLNASMVSIALAASLAAAHVAPRAAARNDSSPVAISS